MAVDLGCAVCLKLWEAHGAATADLRETVYGPGREAIEARLEAAAQAIGNHEQECHPKAAAED